MRPNMLSGRKGDEHQLHFIGPATAHIPSAEITSLQTEMLFFLLRLYRIVHF